MSTKKLLCDKIEFAPANYISSIDGDEITFKSGKSFEQLNIRMGLFDEKLKSVTAGDNIIQTLDFSCIGDSTLANLLLNPGIFRLTFSDSVQFILGSLGNPVRCTKITSTARTLKMVFFRNTTEFEKTFA